MWESCMAFVFRWQSDGGLGATSVRRKHATYLGGNTRYLLDRAQRHREQKLAKKGSLERMVRWGSSNSRAQPERTITRISSSSVRNVFNDEALGLSSQRSLLSATTDTDRWGE